MRALTLNNSLTTDLALVPRIFENLDLLAGSYPFNETGSKTFPLATVTISIKRQPASEYSGDEFSASSASITLPASLLDGLEVADLRLSYSAFTNAALFTPRQQREGVSVGSVVISATVVGVEAVENLESPVQLSFGRKKVWCYMVLKGASHSEYSTFSTYIIAKRNSMI